MADAAFPNADPTCLATLAPAPAPPPAAALDLAAAAGALTGAAP